MGWNDTDITQDKRGWWCGGQCWETEDEAQQHQTRLTDPNQSPITHDGVVIRHTRPVTRLAGLLSYNTSFEVNGQPFNVLSEAMHQWKKQNKKPNGGG